ncbi:hypothetical protein PYW07_007413 [Mythimna separata]|uniref:Uncharacterized protein n=1 Tax=Mythimna separata TaxID=271217 RepID=A0AAD8E143_MYTSE|nr:hypothetical protein PYW07_007413 [Mythimna separata]
MEETKETNLLKGDNESGRIKEEVLDPVKEKADINSWGYAVGFGTVITFIAGIGHVNSFGLIYNDFINETQSTAKSLTSAHGVFAIMLAIGGIILNSITKRYSLRFGGIIGAVLLTTGSFSTIFITNTNQLPLTFGVLQGIGFGMVVPVCYSTLNHYFRDLINRCWNILTHISWNARNEIRQATKKNTNNALENGNGLENEDLLRAQESNKDSVKTNQKERSKNFFGKIRQKLVEILEFKILKDAVYCNICFGQSFVNFSDLTFFILQPMLLFQYGYDRTQVAMCISICAAADVGGRFALAIISSMFNINTRVLYYTATLLTFLIRLVMLQITQFAWMATVTGALGVLRAWLHVASPLIISNHVPHEDFPGAYALAMLAAGTVNVTFSPLIGLLKDVYQDYVPAFYAITLCCIPCLLFWPIEYVIKTK